MPADPLRPATLCPGFEGALWELCGSFEVALGWLWVALPGPFCILHSRPP